MSRFASLVILALILAGAVLTVGWNGYIFKQIKKPPKGVATETLRERAQKFLLNAVS